MYSQPTHRPFTVVLLAVGLLVVPTGPTRADEGTALCALRLEGHLQAWEAAVNRVRDAHYQIRWSHHDPVWGSDEMSYGNVLMRKPDVLYMELRDKSGKPTTGFLCDGQQAHFYEFGTRREWVLAIPSGYPESSLQAGSWRGCIARQALHRFKWLYLGFPVREMRRDYRIRLEQEDAHWVYLWVHHPTAASAKEGDFRTMRVVLSQKDHRVRMVSMWDLQGHVDSWAFNRTDINLTPPVTPEAARKSLPTDFRVVLRLKSWAIFIPPLGGGVTADPAQGGPASGSRRSYSTPGASRSPSAPCRSRASFWLAGGSSGFSDSGGWPQRIVEPSWVFRIKPFADT